MERTRLSLMTTALLAAVLVVLGPAAPVLAAPPASPWYQAGWNQSRTGSNPAAQQLTNAAVRSLHQVWSVRTSEPCCGPPGTSAAVSARGITYVVGFDGSVRAVDAGTGAARWSGGASCLFGDKSPALHLGVLVVASDACTPDDYNSHLTAYNAATGALLWTRKGVAQTTAPLTTGGVVYTQTYVGGFTRTVVQAVDVHTGRLIWQRNEPFGALAADSDSLLLSTSSTLTALDLGTGAVRWSRSVAGGHVLVSGGHVVVGGGGSVTAFSTSGTQQWTTPVYGSSPVQLAATASEVVAAATEGYVQALRLTDGGYSWSTSFSTDITAQPTIAGGVVYVPVAAPRSGAVYALRDGTGATLWSYTDPATGSDPSGSAQPVVANGTLLVSLGSGVLRALRTR